MKYMITRRAKRKDGKRHIMAKFATYEEARAFFERLNNKRTIYQICDGKYNVLIEKDGSENV